MSIAPDAFVIGLTGPFGSGCSTSAELLRERLWFHHVKLSAPINTEWRTHNPDISPRRCDLQALGDSMRREHGASVLVDRTLDTLHHDPTVYRRIAIDGIRNLSEVQRLRDRFGRRFFLFALQCPTSERWERLKPLYENSGGQDAFSADDKRDHHEEDPSGQQVQLCVDTSDVLITNDDRVTRADLRDKLASYVRLVNRELPRYAEPIEILMNLAYSASHGSKCLKRQVGAVLVNAKPGRMGEVIGTGFNDNPPPTRPCVEEPRYGASKKTGKQGACYRDLIRFDALTKSANQNWRCVHCGTPIQKPTHTAPPWRCTNTACNKPLESALFPERAMTWCTAVHAELWAILAAGHRARGCTLYTTTFPCFQCAEKIVQVGIPAIVFSEPYPDIPAAGRLEIGKVKTVRFEGVRSSRFHEIFSAARPFFDRRPD